MSIFDRDREYEVAESGEQDSYTIYVPIRVDLDRQWVRVFSAVAAEAGVRASVQERPAGDVLRVELTSGDDAIAAIERAAGLVPLAQKRAGESGHRRAELENTLRRWWTHLP